MGRIGIVGRCLASSSGRKRGTDTEIEFLPFSILTEGDHGDVTVLPYICFLFLCCHAIAQGEEDVARTRSIRLSRAARDAMPPLPAFRYRISVLALFLILIQLTTARDCHDVCRDELPVFCYSFDFLFDYNSSRTPFVAFLCIGIGAFGAQMHGTLRDAASKLNEHRNSSLRVQRHDSRKRHSRYTVD